MMESVAELADTSSYGFAALVLAAILVLALSQQRKGTRHLPPAPPALKSKSQPWLAYTEAAKEYGDIISYNEKNKITIVLNSAEAANDLLEKRSAIYSSRPRLILANVARRGLSGPVAPYGEVWRKWRKVTHAALMSRAADNYKPWQLLESTMLLKALVQEPEDWRNHFVDYAVNVTMQISYGIRPKGRDDALLTGNRKAVRGQMLRIASGSLIESFPSLRFTPRFLDFLLPALHEARAAYDRDLAMWTGLLDDVSKRNAKGNVPWSFASDVLGQAPEKHGLTPSQMAFAIASPFASGVDTTSSFMTAFVAAVAADGPSFLPRATKEVDAVVGDGRLPTFEDVERLPCVAAIGKEVHRWGGIGPLGGIPHAVIQDDTYRGYNIPKGATVLANTYAMHSDPLRYPSPERFKPERFLEDDNLPHFGWGYGRRICPGQHLAENAYSIAIARMIWAFDMKASGPHFDQSPANISDVGIMRVYKNIPVDFKIRSEKHAQVIALEAAAAELELDQAQ